MSSAFDNSNTLQIAGVSCNHCGAPLQLPQGMSLAICTYCGAKLEVLHDGGAAYTRVLDDIDHRTQRIEASVEELNHREQLERLDREWMQSRGQYMRLDKNGNASVPTRGGAIGVLGGVCAAVFGTFIGVIWIGFTLLIRAPFFFSLFGVVFILFALIGGIAAATTSSNYGRAEAQYQRNRRRLLSNIQSQKTA